MPCRPRLVNELANPQVQQIYFGIAATAHRGRQAEPLWASGRHGYLGRLPPWSQGLGAGGTALGRHRPRHWALARTQGQERGCQRASDIGAGKPRAAQAPA